MQKLPLSNDSVLKALSYVEDPDLKKDLVTLNMIRNLSVQANTVSFSLVLTTPACPLKETIKQACITAIQQFIAEPVEINIRLESDVTSARLPGKSVLPEVKNILAIASGKGGVGKSTVAVNLALALSAQGAQVGLLDADIYGPSIPIMLGLKGMRPEVVEDNGKPRIIPIEKHGIRTISIGLLIEDRQAVVWRGPMVSSALRQLVNDCQWGALDYLIVDLPPGTGDIHLTLVQTVPLTGALIVTTPQAVAIADARKALAMFTMQPISVPVLGVVENMAYFAPDDHPEKKYFLFGEGGGARLADEFKVTFLGAIPLLPSVRESGDAGIPAMVDDAYQAAQRAFSQLAGEVARQVAIRNANFEPTQVVELTHR